MLWEICLMNLYMNISQLQLFKSKFRKNHPFCSKRITTRVMTYTRPSIQWITEQKWIFEDLGGESPKQSIAQSSNIKTYMISVVVYEDLNDQRFANTAQHSHGFNSCGTCLELECSIIKHAKHMLVGIMKICEAHEELLRGGIIIISPHITQSF